jgi:bifunctional pyridoxal-dependent enzyme with beta-cystathionase and maltose regulon repressor activities
VAKKPLKKKNLDFFKEELKKNILCLKIAEEYNKYLISLDLKKYMMNYIHLFLAMEDGEDD